MRKFAQERMSRVQSNENQRIHSNCVAWIIASRERKEAMEKRWLIRNSQSQTWAGLSSQGSHDCSLEAANGKREGEQSGFAVRQVGEGSYVTGTTNARSIHKSCVSNLGNACMVFYCRLQDVYIKIAHLTSYPSIPTYTYIQKKKKRGRSKLYFKNSLFSSIIKIYQAALELWP